MTRESNLPALACDRADCQLRPAVIAIVPPVQPSIFPMPFAPEVHQLIEQVEEISERPVHVMEEANLQARATVTSARSGAPAHMIRFRPGSASLDYLVASQLMFILRTFSCPAANRWEIAATTAEQDAGIEAMGMTEFSDPFARAMIGQIVTQLRTYSIGFRVDGFIWKNLPGLRQQQEIEIRSQLAENERALAPEIRGKFPKPLVDTNTTMNALYAMFWSGLLEEPRFTIPFVALGYRGKATELKNVLHEIPDEPANDRLLVESWGEILGLSSAFHFNSYSTD